MRGWRGESAGGSAGGKADAVAAFNRGTVKRFGAKNSRFPQGCTDYDRWKGATEQYPVTYCNRSLPLQQPRRAHVTCMRLDACA